MQQTIRSRRVPDGHVPTRHTWVIRDVSSRATCTWLALGCFLFCSAAHAQSVPVRLITTVGQPVGKGNATRPRINVIFEKIDSEDHVILKYGALMIKTRLMGVKIKSGAAGVLGMLLPEGVSLQAEVVEKGAIPGIILWKGKVNLNEQLLIQGVAEGVH